MTGREELQGRRVKESGLPVNYRGIVLGAGRPALLKCEIFHSKASNKLIELQIQLTLGVSGALE